MNNRIKNIFILLTLIIFFSIIYIMPVACIIKQATGFYCPACGLTRAFFSILSFDFISAVKYNILSIPLFIFIIFTVISLVYEIITNKFNYIPYLLNCLSKRKIIFVIFFLLGLSCVINNF